MNIFSMNLLVWLRPIIAFLIVPAIVPILIATMRHPNSFYNLIILWDKHLRFDLILSYFSTIIIGLPVYLFLYKKHLLVWWSYILVGGFVGMVPSFIILLGDRFSLWSLFYMVLAAVYGFCLGAPSGLLFWLIAEVGQPKTR